MKYLNPEDKEEVFGPDHGQVELVKDELKENLSKNDKILAELVSSPFVTEEIPHASHVTGNGKLKSLNTDAPLCNNCGTIMVHAGSCYSCPNCFATTGVCN